MNKNVKMIIKGIVGLGAMGGAAYLAYKLGESNGESKERVRAMAEFDDDDDIELDEDDDDYRFYDNIDEPNDGCLAPAARENGYKFKPVEPFSIYDDCDTKPTKRDVLKKYSPFERIYVAGVERGKLRTLLLHLAIIKYFDRDEIVRYFDGDEKTADTVIQKYEDAGYITKHGKYKFRCLLTTEEYCRLVE